MGEQKSSGSSSVMSSGGEVINGSKQEHNINAVDAAALTGEDSSDDDFGNFSDASFEEETESKLKELSTDAYLDELLPDTFAAQKNQTIDKVSLADLISEERPHVIFEQLVKVRSVPRPFIWDKSHLKASLWHILNIPVEETLEHRLKKKRDPLNDSLFFKFQSLIRDSNIHSNFILKDHFKLSYYPPLMPASVQDVDEEDQEIEIPKYLAIDPDNVKDLKGYHDALCHAIDVLFVNLQHLSQKESSLVSDKTTFESVVTNLTGHTQRLHRDEIAFYNKKMRRKSKFGW